MDAHAVPHIVPHENLAAAGREAGYVARQAVHNDEAVVHGVTRAVLPVAVYSDARAIHEGAQVVAGSAVNVYLHGQAQVGAEVPLAIDVDELYLQGAVLHHLAEPRVQLLVVEAGGVYLHRRTVVGAAALTLVNSPAGCSGGPIAVGGTLLVSRHVKLLPAPRQGFWPPPR